MKIAQLATVSLLLQFASVPSFARDAHPKTPFFRNRNAVLKPHDNSGPVVVNAASYLPGVSPGGLATVFGQNLSTVTGIISSTTNPLPLTLGGVSVTVNGLPAPMFSVAYANGQDQISFETPYDTPVGLGAADVQVLNDGVPIVTITVDSFTEDPGIFGYYTQGTNYAVAVHSDDNSVIGPNNPAVRGEAIVVYTTGLGPLSVNLVDGYGAPSNPLAYTVDPFQVVIAGENAQVVFSGLAPGFSGLYQVNIVLPNDLPAGDLPVQLLSQYANSQKVYLSVQ